MSTPPACRKLSKNSGPIGAGVVTRTYTYGLQRISQNLSPAVTGNSTWTPSFYVYDGAGSVRQLTNSAGVVTDEYEYDAYGNSFTKTGSTPNNYCIAANNTTRPSPLLPPRQILQSQGHYDFSNIRASVGTGLRILIPAFGPMPLCFDLAFPVPRPPRTRCSSSTSPSGRSIRRCPGDAHVPSSCARSRIARPAAMLRSGGAFGGPGPAIPSCSRGRRGRRIEVGGRLAEEGEGDRADDPDPFVGRFAWRAGLVTVADQPEAATVVRGRPDQLTGVGDLDGVGRPPELAGMGEPLGHGGEGLEVRVERRGRDTSVLAQFLQVARGDPGRSRVETRRGPGASVPSRSPVSPPPTPPRAGRRRRDGPSPGRAVSSRSDRAMNGRAAAALWANDGSSGSVRNDRSWARPSGVSNGWLEEWPARSTALQRSR